MPIDMLHDRKEKKNVGTIGFVQLYIISQHESPRVLRASVVVFKKKIGRAQSKFRKQKNCPPVPSFEHYPIFHY
jgi:hypothetical protein